MKGSQLSGLLAPGSLFEGAEPSDLDAIAARAMPRHFDRGETIVMQGDEGESFYILTSGVARVAIIAANGREITLDFLETGAIVGEIAVLDGGERTASVIAHEPTDALRLDRRALRDIIVERIADRGVAGADPDYLAASCIGIAREVGDKMLERRPIDTKAATDFAVSMILGGLHGQSGG